MVDGNKYQIANFTFKEFNAMKKINFVEVFFVILLLIAVVNTKATAVTLSIPDKSGFAGATCTIPILIDDATDIAGADILLSYDPEILTALEAKTTTLTFGFIIADSIANGKIAISLARASGIEEGSGNIVDITFQVKSTAIPGDTSPLILQKVALYDDSNNLISVTTVNGSFTVEKQPEKISVLPNPFTPNNDGFNDFVEFAFPDMFEKKSEIIILNIAGRLVKRISSPEYTWDGIDGDGRVLEPGVYIYLIKVDGKNISNGTITIMR